MDIIVKIDGYKDCRHRDHSGAFTQGGAKPICGHPQATEHFTTPEAPDRYHWKYRVVNIDVIPACCPLRAGANY